ncbi:FAD-dependent monooxygenase [Couchioplanes caeruleus]|uniref:Oxidoreductase n=2 Tax=Couchioplanes caeruleus TaxID=56438 RepID=A0A1K0GEK2_9ACTN|nr:FAD-dependent monooxygenase [Couchioplanes caeruleus]OJF15658.1 Oxidoreductase [Couchioplanes caeruleus subsp. caeruleus]ROP33842.1 2-polyprenyl-6-methoxyphenol hydroxylase-like FAD-dependent oxidoreductase [Couchioplanes caeruleus]
MRISVNGGGPAGLAFAVFAARSGRDDEITVWDRTGAEDTYGFGVVLPPAVVEVFRDADPALADELSGHVADWDRLTVHRHGRSASIGAPRLGAMDRRTLLRVLRRRCAELGVGLVRGAVSPAGDGYDLVVAADGARSVTRGQRAQAFGTTTRQVGVDYIWLGAGRAFDNLTFLIAETPAGPAVAHVYPYGPDRSTFLVEAQGHPAPDELADWFAGPLGGARLLENRSRWSRFKEVRNSTWSSGNVVLVGDAAHTSHYSIGSGTRLALDDAQALAAALCAQPRLADALAAYEAERRPVVEHTQRVGRLSAEWFADLPDAPVDRLMSDLATRGGRLSWRDLTEGRRAVPIGG